MTRTAPPRGSGFGRDLRQSRPKLLPQGIAADQEFVDAMIDRQVV